MATEISGSYLVIPYDSWATQIRLSGGFSLLAFMRMQLSSVEDAP